MDWIWRLKTNSLQLQLELDDRVVWKLTPKASDNLIVLKCNHLRRLRSFCLLSVWKIFLFGWYQGDTVSFTSCGIFHRIGRGPCLLPSCKNTACSTSLFTVTWSLSYDPSYFFSRFFVGGCTPSPHPSRPYPLFQILSPYPEVQISILRLSVSVLIVENRGCFFLCLCTRACVCLSLRASVCACVLQQKRERFYW